MKKTMYIQDGIFTPTADGLTLLAHRCKLCKKVYFPKVHFCAHCYSADLEELPLSRKGRLFTYTTTYMSSSNITPPYANGLVDTPEGARVFALLSIVKEKPFRLDMEMVLDIGPLWQEGENEIIGYQFRPA